MNEKIIRGITASCQLIDCWKDPTVKSFHFQSMFHLSSSGILGGNISPIRRLNIYHLLSSVLCFNLKGDVVEIGTHKGLTALFMQDIIDFYMSEKNIHVFDSFIGIPTPSKYDGSKYSEGSFASNIDEFIETFIDSKLPVIHACVFDQKILNDLLPSEICFAHIDTDLYQSTIDGLNAVWPKLIDGGVVLIDDYDHPDFPGVTKAVHEFRNDYITLNIKSGSTFQCFFRKKVSN